MTKSPVKVAFIPNVSLVLFGSDLLSEMAYLAGKTRMGQPGAVTRAAFVGYLCGGYFRVKYVLE